MVPILYMTIQLFKNKAYSVIRDKCVSCVMTVSRGMICTI